MKRKRLSTVAAIALWTICGENLAAAEAPWPDPTIAREGSRLTVTFLGVLVSASSPSGPWTDVPGAASPFLTDAEGAQKFFRTRDANAGGIFSSAAIVALAISGPMQQHFDLAFAGLPDGIFPPVREKPYFDGALQLDGVEIPIKLRVRGNSSLQECPFPKLKFKVTSENRPGTPFADAREVKIGTHCAEGGQGNVGRLRDERAAWREALAYELMASMGYISPRVRRAQIDYRDTTPADAGASDAGWTVKRNAMLFDDIEVVAERLGGRALEDAEIAALSKAAFDEQLIVELEMFHALLGNWDYVLSTDGQGLWNTDVIELPNGQLVPVAGDFDLASFVTGEVRASAPRDYRPDLEDVEREAVYKLEQLQARFAPALFDAAMERYRSNRDALQAAIAAAAIDEEGRENALRHFNAFFDNLPAR